MATDRPLRSWSGRGDILGVLYHLGVIATFVKLTLLDDYPYTWWNWIIVVPINGILSMMWPIYWLILRPLTH